MAFSLIMFCLIFFWVLLPIKGELWLGSCLVVDAESYMYLFKLLHFTHYLNFSVIDSEIQAVEFSGLNQIDGFCCSGQDNLPMKVESGWSDANTKRLEVFRC